MPTAAVTSADSLSLDAKVVMLGIVNALFMTAGNFFQKFNGTRSGNMLFSVWVVAATLCFMPTFFIGNRVYLMGGRLSVFVPITALAYVMTTLVGKYYFQEELSLPQLGGCLLILVGVALIARA